MNAKKLAYTSRHFSLPSWTPGGRSRDSYSLSREANASDSVCSDDGSSSLLAETAAKGRIMSRWFKDRPKLLPYVAAISTLELIVTLWKG